MSFVNVNSRLPEEKRDLVVVVGKSISHKIYENGIFFQGSFGVAGPRGVVNPTHWMYLSDLLDMANDENEQKLQAV